MMGWIEKRPNNFLNKNLVRQGLPAKSESVRFRFISLNFFKQTRSDDPDCDSLTKAKEMLLEQDKRGFGSSKHLLYRCVFGFSEFGH
jgi:hypothetical protein